MKLIPTVSSAWYKIDTIKLSRICLLARVFNLKIPHRDIIVLLDLPSIVQPADRLAFHTYWYTLSEEDYAEANKSYLSTSRPGTRSLFFHCIMGYVRFPGFDMSRFVPRARRPNAVGACVRTGDTWFFPIMRSKTEKRSADIDTRDRELKEREAATTTMRTTCYVIVSE